MKNYKFYLTTVLGLLEQLDCATSLSVAICLRYGVLYSDEPLPCDYNCNYWPSEISSPSSYFNSAQAVALVRKNPWILEKNNSLESEALKKFLEAEEACRLTNIKFRELRFSFRTRSLLEEARIIAHQILGVVSVGNADFGPGASVLLRGSEADLISKLRKLPECTQEAHHIVLNTMLRDLPGYCVSSGLVIRERTSLTLSTTKLPIVRGNVFTSVPKDLRANRPICIEPLGNMLIQKAYGESIRRRLRLNGLDLSIQPLRNQRLAREGSVDDSYSTIDLSSASDTMAYEFVKFILPIDWFDALNSIRCARTSVGEFEIKVEKFSSMGNGFTFELESLLFYCLCKAVSRVHEVGVYGDDIVIRKEYFSEIVSLLNEAGFSCNAKKTFSEGPFRETCGADFFNGLPVRPVYLKELPSNETLQLYYLANRVREISHRSYFGICCNNSFHRSWTSLVRRIPLYLRHYGSVGSGDVTINVNWTEVPFVHEDYHVKQRCLIRVSRRKRLPADESGISAILYGLSSQGIETRSSSKRYVVRIAVLSLPINTALNYSWS